MHPLQLKFVEAKQVEFEAYMAHQRAKEAAEKAEKAWREVYMSEQTRTEAENE